MQWSGLEINAGFSNAEHTWLPVNPNYIAINVDSENENTYSHLNIYKTLIYERRADLVFDFGGVNIRTGNNILAFSRTDPRLYYETVTMVNFNSHEASYDFSDTLGTKYQTGIAFISTYGTYQQG